MAEIAGREQGDLPDTVHLTQKQIDRYFPIWAQWRALDKRHLPSQIAAEPAEQLAAVLEIEALFQAVTRPQKAQESYSAE